MSTAISRDGTDGLPVIPPTEARVLKFLEISGRHASDVIGVEPVRGRVITAEKVAINAVMAGCRAEYMPVIIAAVEGMVQPEYNLHGSSASTGGSAPLLVINGPVRQKLGFASGDNLFGPGPDRRANATVGRAIRLMLINVLENHPGVLGPLHTGTPRKVHLLHRRRRGEQPLGAPARGAGLSQGNQHRNLIHVHGPLAG